MTENLNKIYEEILNEVREKRIFKKTDDDWYPNFPNNEVKVSLLNVYGGLFRVCVWGADDDGREKDFKNSDEAEKVFNKLSMMDVINKSDLKIMGFVRS